MAIPAARPREKCSPTNIPSADVILSPAKPQLKNVTGEDVNNCLYYVHLNLPGEEPPAPLQDPDQPRRSGESSRSQQQIRRKPLPANSRAAPGLAQPADASAPAEPSAPDQPRALEAREDEPRGAEPQESPLAPPEPPFAADNGVAPAVAFAADIPSNPSPTFSDPPPPYPGAGSPERPSVLDHPAFRPAPPPRPVSLVGDHQARPELPPRPVSLVGDHEVRPELPPRPGSVGRPRSASVYSQDTIPPPPPPHGVRFVEPGSPADESRTSLPIRRSAPVGIPPRADMPRSHGVRFPEASASPDRLGTTPPLGRSLPGRSPPRPSIPRPATSRSPSPTKAATYSPYVAFSLTIIRRDPSSGQQWNVGRVSSYQVETEEESGYIHQRPAYDAGPEPPPINIDIENSGYCKFRGMPTRQSVDVSRTFDTRLHAHGSAPAPPADHAPDPQSDFHRQAVMTYAKGLRSNLREKFRAPDPDAEMHPRVHHSRDRSTDSTDSDNEPLTQPGPGLRRQGYMFTSPWDGRCVFRTGNAGRTVTCRHVLPGQSSASNPLVPGSTDRRKAKLGVYPPVSELRFNLPVADLLKSRDEAAQQLHDHFHKLVRPKHGGGEGYSSDEEYSVLPFDLSLGREKAGGGRRGRRAKLGKLIVYDEGVKMLDLVVAANMGIWWGAWEKSYWA